MQKIEFEYSRQSFMSGFDRKTCKVIPSICTDGKTVLMAYNKILLTGIDVTIGTYMSKSTDGGKTFTEPVLQKNLADTYENGVRHNYNGTVYYNKHHKKWFALGLSTSYKDDKEPVSIDGISIVEPIYFDIDPLKGEFINYKSLEFPFEYVSAYSMGQIIEFEDGDMLVPFNFTTKENTKAMVVTVRYRFYGDELKVVNAGTPIISSGSARGYCEPSIAKLYDKYYLTIRTDEIGLFAVSEDGYTFEEPKPYVWNDGSLLENYNTQQHWVINKNGLFLAYTRKGAHNDHVFRHRAPIFMTRFDEDRQCLIREDEVILVPELGARLGNFCVTEANENESWLVTAEWMQSWDGDFKMCERYGSNNSLWLSKIYWKN